MIKAYVSAKYRANSPAEVEQNIRNAVEYGKILRHLGNMIEPVIPHTFIKERWGLDTNRYDAEINEFNHKLIDQCQIVYVVTPDNLLSSGMRDEIDYAQKTKKNVVIVEFGWLMGMKDMLERTMGSML
jgi:hypothetical protein